MQTDNLFVEYGNDMPVRLPMHKNPGLEIVYIKRGHLLWECEGTPETILPETLYFTLPWQEHGSTRLFESGYEVFFFVIKLGAYSPDDPAKIEFQPELGFSPETGEAISQLLYNCTQHAWPASPLTKTVMPEIQEELTHPGPFHHDRIKNLLKLMILELAKTVQQESDRSDLPANSAWRLQSLLKRLGLDFGQKWTLKEMTAETGLKRTQFSVIFKHATGESPLSYLTSLRVSKAADMLENTNHSITDIAFQCGFSSSQHFANTFKQKVGQTPLKYRKQGAPNIQVPRERGSS